MKRGIQLALCASVIVRSVFAADATWEGPFYWDGERYAGSGPFTSDSGTQWPYGQMTVHMSHVYGTDSEQTLLVWAYGNNNNGHQTPEVQTWHIGNKNWVTPSPTHL